MTNSTQIAKSPNPFKMTLEVATFDFRSTRIQFALGFTFTLIAFTLVVQEFFATRFFSEEYLTVGKMLRDGVLTPSFFTSMQNDPVLSIQFFLFSHHAWWYRIATFIANSLSAMAVGLITLELTIRYGNRTGASAAIFAALLYLAVPYHNALTFPATMLPVLLSNFFALFAVFLDLRLRLLRETEYYWLTLLCLCLSGVLNVSGAVMAITGIALARLFIKENEKRCSGGALHSYIGLTIYFLTALVFIVPQVGIAHGATTSPQSIIEFVTTLSGINATGKITPRVLPILLVTISSISIIRLVMGSLWLRPLVFAKLWLVLSVTAWWIFGLALTNEAYTTAGIFLSPALSILLSLCALPCIDVLTKKARVFFTTVGALAASAVIVFWGAMVANDVDQQYARARELGLFKVALAKRMEKTGGKLVVVNPPFPTVETEMERQPEFSLAYQKDRENLILQSLLDSPLTGDHIPVVSHRRQAIAFPRIAKKENQTANPRVPASMVTDFYVWSGETGQLMPVYYSGAASIDFAVSEQNMKTEPPDVIKIKASEWAQINREEPFIEIGEDGLRLNPGSKTDVTAWFTHESLDPTKASKIILTCAPQRAGQESMSLVFKGKDSEEVGVIQLRKLGNQIETTMLEANTRGVPDWNKHSRIATLGIKLKAGTPGIVVKTVKAGK